jgi:hypothetical protein
MYKLFRLQQLDVQTFYIVIKKRLVRAHDLYLSKNAHTH